MPNLYLIRRLAFYHELAARPPFSGLRPSTWAGALLDLIKIEFRVNPMCLKPSECWHRDWLYAVAPSSDAKAILTNIANNGYYGSVWHYIINTNEVYVDGIWARIKAAIEKGHLGSVGARCSTRLQYYKGFGVHRIFVYNSYLDNPAEMEANLWNYLWIRKKLSYSPKEDVYNV